MTAKLTALLGRSGSGKTAACLRAMRDRLLAAPDGPALVLVTQEHEVYQAERRLAACIPEEAGRGYLRAYVFGFRRLSEHVLQETGGAALPRITDIGRRLLIRRVLERRQKDLTIFARAARQHGFGEELAGIIRECKSYGLNADALQETSGQAKDPRLAGKLRDMALLLRDFEAEMAGKAADGEDRLQAFATHIPDSELLRGAEIWIDGFTFFNPQERAVLEALLDVAAAVHVTFPMDPDLDSPANVRESGLLHRAYQTFLDLGALAKRQGTVLHVGRLTGNHRSGEPALAHIERELFHFPQRALEGASDGVQIVEAANPRLETEAVAADILRLLRGGCPASAIGVLVRDEETYMGLLRRTFRLYGIPFYMDSKRAGIHHPLAELLRSVFDALRGWRPEAVFRCLRTGFWPLMPEEIDQLENYVLAYGIRGEKRWTREEPWDWHRQHDLESDEITDEQKEQLAEIDYWRRTAAAPLEELAGSLRGAQNAREQTAALYAFLEALEVPAHLAEWERLAREEGRQDDAAEHQKIWGDLIELFDQFVAVSGEEKLSLRDYADILSDGLDSMQLAMIPPGLDHVTIAPFDQNSLAGARAIYIVGAVEGVMPRKVLEQGLLTDADRLHLREMGVELSGGGIERSYGESALLYHGFTEARDDLWVSYALADSEGKEQRPSSLIGRLRRILPGAPFRSIPLRLTGDETLARAAAPYPALSAMTTALCALREGRAIAPFWRDVYNLFQAGEVPGTEDAFHLSLAGLFAGGHEKQIPVALARELYAKSGRLRGSVTRFEAFRKCPFQHFAKYGLKLGEREEFRYQALDLGVLLHGILKEFGERLAAGHRMWRDVGDEEAHALVHEILVRLAPRLRGQLMLSTAAYQHLLERIARTAERSIHRLIALDKVSHFHPAAFETAFGPGGAAMPPLSADLDGTKLEVVGQIDRIDQSESGRYFLIYDYKTGGAAINLLEVYYGLRLQLLTYLLVVSQARKKDGALPAGMLYCFLRYELLSADTRLTPEQAEKELQKKLQMPGWVLADADVIQAIDSTLTFLPISVNKDGSLSKTSRAHVKTAEEFQTLLDYVHVLLEDTGRRILQGEMQASPYRLKDDNTACKYCPYKDLCGFDPAQGSAYRDIPKTDDAELMRQIQHQIEQ